MTTFDQLPLLPTLIASLTEQGLTSPTDIQRRALPPLLEGRSLVGVAETGSGKTLAYALPLLDRLKRLEESGDAVDGSGRPRGLVLVPGRELGDQVSRVFKGLTHGTRLRVRTVLGGTAKQIARQNVSGAFEILVATPGRLLQLLDTGGLQLDDVRTLVVDEADQMLDVGFRPDAKRIVAACPPKLQLVMFSATMPQALEALVRDLFDGAPLEIRTKGSQKIVPTLRVENRTVTGGKRFEHLREILVADREAGTLLFANTRAQCETIAKWLDEAGFPFATYVGQMDRAERRAELARFRSGEVSVLVSTDLGGRGLDIDRVDRVVNVHLPQQVDNYLHRVGRTARAGRDGLVINLVTHRDQPLLAALRKKG